MKPEHRIAREFHCRLAAETIHPRFAKRIGSWSQILTVNSGYEWIEAGYGGPVWHVSIARHGRDGRVMPLPADHSEWSLRADRALYGVGDARLGEWRELGSVAVHLRRRLTPTEAAELEVIDVRNTGEEQRRLAPLRYLLPPGYHE